MQIERWLTSADLETGVVLELIVTPNAHLIEKEIKDLRLSHFAIGNAD